MRKLMWFAIGFAAACGIGAYLDPGNWLLPLALAGLFGLVGMWYLMQWKNEFRVGCAIFLGLTVGFAWFLGFDQLYLSRARELDGQQVPLEIRMTDYSWENEYGTSCDGKIKIDGRTYQIRVYLSKSEPLVPGDRVLGNFRIKTTTGGEETTFHRGEGIFLLGYQKGSVEYRLSDYLESRDLPTYWRFSLINLMDRIFPADTAPFAKALLLGDDTDLDYETETDLKVSGLRHVVAVSGLHITVLFSLIFYTTGRKRYISTLAVVPVLLLFAAVVGFTPSVTRACVMQCLVMIGLSIRRNYDPPTSLAFAALLMLAINPMIITSVSFQMSMCCSAGIFCFARPIKHWLMDRERLGRFGTYTLKARFAYALASSVSISLATTLMTTPLAALYFGTVSLVSLFSNLLTLWMVSIVFFGLMLTCGIGLIWAAGGKALAWLFSWGIRYVLGVAKLVEGFRFSAVFTANPSVTVWILVAYLLLLIRYLLKMQKKLVIGCCILIALCASYLVAWMEPLRGECRMTVLDVGQGQCILLQSDGKTFMVDCGGSHDEAAADLAAETLLSQGIGRLDGMILTHYDRDHVGGVELFLTRIPTSTVFLPDTEDVDKVKDGILDRILEEKILVSKDMQITYGPAMITIFAPMEGKTGNESSMCVLFQRENYDILITGDNTMEGELHLLEHTALPDLEVLIVGHHGSRYSTAPELLAATTPEIAVISVDENNVYGHPTQEVLDRLTDAGCIIRRTDLDGTVVIQR